MRDGSTRRALSPHGERHTGLDEERMAPGSVEHAAPGCVWRGGAGRGCQPAFTHGAVGTRPGRRGRRLPILPRRNMVKTLAHAYTGGPHPENRTPQMPFGVYVKVTSL